MNIHPDIAKLKELMLKEEDGELVGDDFYQLDSLQIKRNLDKAKLIPTPKCCQAIQEYPVVWFCLNYHKDGKNSLEVDGNWHITIPENPGVKRSYEWYGNFPSPKFCPFCGEDLPKMKIKDPVPDYIAVIEYDSNYCETCGERCISCLCDPPEAAWEIDDSQYIENSTTTRIKGRVGKTISNKSLIIDDED
jgi:hypothetical protein